MAILVGVLASGTVSEAGHSRLRSIRIDNFGGVDSSYFRGAQPSGLDYQDLAALGVKLVIDLQRYAEASEPGLVRNAGMQYVNIPLGTDTAPTADEVTQFLALVNNPANQPVYVHCAGGIHRTGVMTAAYRQASLGWSADEAFAEMKRYHFGSDHPHLKQFVYRFADLNTN
jgi:tyrosine-protein phosphatase SIW14